MRPSFTTPLCLILFAFTAFGNTPDAKDLRRLLQPSYRPIEQNIEASAKVELGRKLYHDPRLSPDNTTSCNSCHDLQAYGTNGTKYRQQLEVGYSGRDVPSIYNIGSLELFDWDGSSKTLKGKIRDAIRSPNEMQNTSTAELVERIQSVESYQALFTEAYGESDETITYPNIAEALEAFISGLVTKAPIDHFMAGDDTALTAEQIQGGHLFTEHACYTCHTGTNFGGQMLQKVGIIQPWPNQKDLGYYELTHNSAHKMFFRVSPLRNVEKTAPYFHDKSSKNVRDAIQRMAIYERGHYIDAENTMTLQAFLKSLTGPLPEEYIQAPISLK